MARNKDTNHVLPVDRYRKHIGKQDYKKSKTDLKEIKAKALARENQNSVYKDVSIMVGCLMLVIGILYLLLYLYLEKKEEAAAVLGEF